MDNSLLAVRDINHKYIVVERKMIKEVTELSVQVKKILDQLPKEERVLITEYLEKKELIADHDCSHLYTQGVRDCLKFLKTLELI